MIGYKAFDKDLRCRGFQYKVGKTYTKDTKKEDLVCRSGRGFHFCRELRAIEKESCYKLSESRICEVIAGDCVRDGDIYCTNSITILREIIGEEKEGLLSSCNYNSGDWNSGSYNSGDYNSGSYNSGNCNNGSYNSDDCNSGDWNSGNHNSGDWNSGSYNSGSCNSGRWNSGNHNSGDCNSGDWNSGFFNSDEPTVRMFNKDTGLKSHEIRLPSFCYFRLTKWVRREEASEQEKLEHSKELKTYGGFLKTFAYKEAWRNAWDNASKDEHKKTLLLPNYDNEIFKEITGIDAEAEIQKEA